MNPETYLDYHATTPVDPRVLDAMWPYFVERFGNPASRSHAAGREAYRAVETARDQIATFIGARAQDITFTGGATESNNLALKGIVRAHRSGRGSRIVTVVTEHRSVLDTCDALERIAPIVHAAGALLHTDASQAAGKVPLNAPALGVDLMALTAHKMYGPKGIGALYVHPDVGRLEPVLHGGGQERGLRSGTLNVPAIVGFGVAAAVAMAEIDQEAVRVAALRDQLLAGLQKAIPDLKINGSTAARLPHNLHVSVPGVDAEMLGPVLDDLAVSTGSACASGDGRPSYVLSALGLPNDLARASIRFCLGRWTTSSAINHAIERVAGAVLELRRVEAQLRP